MLQKNPKFFVTKPGVRERTGARTLRRQGRRASTSKGILLWNANQSETRSWPVSLSGHSPSRPYQPAPTGPSTQSKNQSKPIASSPLLMTPTVCSPPDPKPASIPRKKSTHTSTAVAVPACLWLAPDPTPLAGTTRTPATLDPPSPLLAQPVLAASGGQPAVGTTTLNHPGTTAEAPPPGSMTPPPAPATTSPSIAKNPAWVG